MLELTTKQQGLVDKLLGGSVGQRFRDFKV